MDVRDLDGEALLASPNPGDNVGSILTRLGNEPETVRRILKRIGVTPPEIREQAVSELLIVAGLRRLTGRVSEEANRMPILNDIMDDEVLGPRIRQGQVEILLCQMEKRFGAVPGEVRDRLASRKAKQLKRASLRLLDAKRIADVFPC